MTATSDPSLTMRLVTRHRCAQIQGRTIQDGDFPLERKTYVLRAVKLADIPLPVRVTAARLVAKQGTEDAPAILYAALHPSDTTYWVRAQAVAPELLAA